MGKTREEPTLANDVERLVFPNFDETNGITPSGEFMALFLVPYIVHEYEELLSWVGKSGHVRVDDVET